MLLFCMLINWATLKLYGGVIDLLYFQLVALVEIIIWYTKSLQRIYTLLRPASRKNN